MVEHRNPADMAHTCRGNISIANALIHTEDSCNFLISNGGTQTFHLRAANEIERSVVTRGAVSQVCVRLQAEVGDGTGTGESADRGLGGR